MNNYAFIFLSQYLTTRVDFICCQVQIPNVLNKSGPTHTVRRNPKEFARLTAPSFLEIKESGISGAGEGVWTREWVPKGTMFGPYAGTRIKSEPEAHKSGYSWEVKLNIFLISTIFI